MFQILIQLFRTCLLILCLYNTIYEPIPLPLPAKIPYVYAQCGPIICVPTVPIAASLGAYLCPPKNAELRYDTGTCITFAKVSSRVPLKMSSAPWTRWTSGAFRDCCKTTISSQRKLATRLAAPYQVLCICRQGVEWFMAALESVSSYTVRNCWIACKILTLHQMQDLET